MANKIAAGEVVERPASVLKELIENALDAGASRVAAEVTAGGRKLVAVSDNGGGMSRDDALLAVERHATSKIRDVDDIERIATLGFRGEALAAIAAVSRFRLVTRREEDPAGTEILITGGRIRDVRECGAPHGTAVEVRDLFHNVPARRKFLRSAQTELSHLRAAFLVQALSHPAAGMSLKVDGRDAYHLPEGAGVEDRIRDLFGGEYLDGLRPLSHRAPDVTVSGYAGLPAISRADRGEQYVLVNGRVCWAPVLGHAVRESYRAVLPSDRHPIVFLFLEMPPERVDVNVHPTKKEVRFRRPAAVRDAVIAAQLQGGAGEKGAGGLFPVIGLKGRIVGPRGLATAVLSVDGNTVFVTPGDEIEIATPRLGLPSVTLKIDQIDAQQVRGTLVQLNRVVLLN